jgi:phytoene/squalene synthetase
MSKQKVDSIDNEIAEWNRKFDALKRQIGRKAAKQYLYALRKAGAQQDVLLELLTATVYDRADISRWMRPARERLTSLADQLTSVTNFAERVDKDPWSDGRFYLALLSRLPWDQVPKPGTVEVATLKIMRAFAERTRKRAAAMGSLSRGLSKRDRTYAMRLLLMYVHSTTNKNFDPEIALLLTDAHEAAGKKKCFSPEQIKKFRQRHLSETSKLRSPVKSGVPVHPGAVNLARMMISTSS